MDNSGTHCGDCDVPLLPIYDKHEYNVKLPQNISVLNEITKNIKHIFRPQKPQKVSVIKWVKRRIKKVLIKPHSQEQAS